MIDALFVTKRFNTYADAFLMLGVARIAEYALTQTRQKAAMQLLDEGRCYRIQFKKPISLEAIAQLKYTDAFPPVCGQKTDSSKLPAQTTPFNTVEKAQARKLYREYLIQNRGKADWQEGAPPPPDPQTQNGVILTSMRHDRNHNDLWLQGWELRDNYGSLIAALLQAFSQEHDSDLNADIQLAADIFKRQTGIKLSEASAVKIFLPTAVQGVSRVKADGNKTDAQKIDWLILWLIANGLFTFAISERVKVAERVYDWRVTALEPRDISFEKFQRSYRGRYLQSSEIAGSKISARSPPYVCQLHLDHRALREVLNYWKVEAVVESYDLTPTHSSDSPEPSIEVKEGLRK